MTMTREQRQAVRHSIEGVKQSALSTAKHFNYPVIVYRCRNGFLMTHGEPHYKVQKHDKPIGIMQPDGKWEEITEFPAHCYVEKYRAMKCQCDHPACDRWMIDPVAAVQGVRFTEEEARTVADFMNRRWP